MQKLVESLRDTEQLGVAAWHMEGHRCDYKEELLLCQIGNNYNYSGSTPLPWRCQQLIQLAHQGYYGEWPVNRTIIAARER